MLGWLRLHLDTAGWGEREREQLAGFVAALASSVRTCQAYAAASAAAAENAHHAYHDPLTGLANRRRLSEHAATVLAARPRRGSVGLLLIDLDGFKQVNDALGHTAGDELLVEAAARLCAAAGDHLAARLGGDEFAVLLTEPTPVMVTHHAHRILAALSGPVIIDGVRLQLSGSGGVAVAGDGHHDLPALLHEADTRMCEAKSSARPVRLGVPTPRRPSTPSMRYEPVVSLANGRATAATARLYWHAGNGDPDTAGGVVTCRRPVDIAVADHLLDDALAAANSWHRAGFPLQLALTPALRRLISPDLSTTLPDQLRRAGLSPRALLLQLTASTIAHLDTVADNLHMLHETGVRFALAEDATAATPLPVLTSLPIPVDQLHVTCRNVGGAVQEPAAAASLRAMVELGRQLGAPVVACQVAQERQRHLLWQYGCTLAQGTMFGRPTTADQLLSQLRQGLSGTPGTLAQPMPAEHHAGHRLRGLRHGIGHA